MDAIAQALWLGALTRGLLVCLVLGGLGAFGATLWRRRNRVAWLRGLSPRRGPAILQRYVLSETIGPILLSVLALTFFLLVQVIYKLIYLLTQPGAVGLALQLLLISLPTLLTLTVPIAILLGVLLGVGRMAVENEIRACQVAGVHLGRVFWPMIVLCGFVSAAMMAVNYEYTPRLAKLGKQLQTRLLYEALSSLPAGIPNDDHKINRRDAVFFFRERDKQTNDMLQVCVMTQFDRGSGQSAKPQAKDEKPEPGAPATLPSRPPSGGAWAAEPATQRMEAVKSPEAAASQPEAKDENQPATQDAKKDEKKTEEKTTRTLENRVIFASRGRVVDDARNKLVNLRLFDGSIHSMGEDLDGKEVEADMKAGKLGPRGTPPAVPRDELVRFSSLEYRIDFSDKEDQKESPQEYTVGQIIQALRSAPAAATGRSESASKVEGKKRKLLVEWAVRTAIPLACVAFVLLGIPLAIFVKPSGKSTGAAIAFALILVYYWMIKWGSSVAEEGGNFGFFIIFLPNVLMAGLGAYLFRRAARL